MEVPPRFELGIEALQASALPLGDGTSSLLLLSIMVPGAGLEPAQCCHRGILSPLRLPISPSGHFYVFVIINGAGNEVRTRDPDLGKVVLYH